MVRAKDFALGVLGGSFNPIHNAHLAMAGEAMRAFSLDEVLFLPTGNPPHKLTGLADKEHRLRIVELAVAGVPGFAVSDLEVRREGTTYTVDTLRMLRARRPDARLWYIIGMDTLLELHTWRDPDTVFALCAFIVCTRPGYREEEGNACAEQLSKRGADIHMLPMPGMDISSTMIRQSISRGGNEARELVPPAVWTYLKAQRLYEP